MIDIIHRIGIKASPAKVYTALSTVDGVAGWWTKETTGESKVGGVITVRFRDHGSDHEKGRMDLEVIELSPGQSVRWRVKAGAMDGSAIPIIGASGPAMGVTAPARR